MVLLCNYTIRIFFYGEITLDLFFNSIFKRVELGSGMDPVMNHFSLMFAEYKRTVCLAAFLPFYHYLSGEIGLIAGQFLFLSLTFSML